VALVSSAEVPTLASLSALRSLWQKHWALAFSDSGLVILRFSMRDLRPPGAVFEFTGLCSVPEALKHPSFGWSVWSSSASIKVTRVKSLGAVFALRGGYLSFFFLTLGDIVYLCPDNFGAISTWHPRIDGFSSIRSFRGVALRKASLLHLPLPVND